MKKHFLLTFLSEFLNLKFPELENWELEVPGTWELRNLGALELGNFGTWVLVLGYPAT